MSNTPHSLAEARRLIADYAIEQLAEEEVPRLRAILIADPQARRIYRSYMALVSALTWDCQPIHSPAVPAAILPAPAPATIAPAAAPARPSRPIGIALAAIDSLRQPFLWIFLGGMGIFAVYVTVITWGMQDREERSSRLEARGSRDVDRGGGDLQASSLAPRASHLAPSQHRRLTLKQGVKLVVEGPAEWSIDGDNRATLTRGRLMATVPKTAIGFTVKTPTSEIVDLGTEFGVQVDERGNTETQVFKGEVRVNGAAGVAGGRVASDRAAAQRPIILKAGQAARIGASRQVTLIAPMVATRDAFMASAPPEPPVPFDPESLSPYVRHVLDETRPVAYWDFSRFQDTLRIVNDRVAEQPWDAFVPANHGVPGPDARSGFAGLGDTNPALYFKGSQVLGLQHAADDLRLSPTSYSVQMWIRPDVAFASRPIQTLFARGVSPWSNASESEYRDNLVIRGSSNVTKNPLLVPGRLSFFAQRGIKEPIFAGKTILELGRWYQVTLVRDEAQVRLYVNGQEEFSAERAWIPGDEDRLTVSHTQSGFCGDLDEVGLWNRALSASEVAAMYRQAEGQTGPEETK